MAEMAKLTVFVELTMYCAAPPTVTAHLATLLEGHTYVTSTKMNGVSIANARYLSPWEV